MTPSRSPTADPKCHGRVVAARLAVKECEAFLRRGHRSPNAVVRDAKMALQGLLEEFGAEVRAS